MFFVYMQGGGVSKVLSKRPPREKKDVYSSLALPERGGGLLIFGTFSRSAFLVNKMPMF